MEKLPPTSDNVRYVHLPLDFLLFNRRFTPFRLGRGCRKYRPIHLLATSATVAPRAGRDSVRHFECLRHDKCRQRILHVCAATATIPT